MEKFELTPEQALAVNILDRHVSLTANAGSGKTAVLTDRVMKIMDVSDDENIIKHIVAITFTNLATAQLRDKIIGKIDARIQNELSNTDAPDYGAIRRFSLIREHISQLRIMTIHGFCNSILREYSVEAGLSSNFKVLEQINASIIKKRVFSNLLIKVFKKDADSSFKKKVEKLSLAFGGTNELQKAVVSILNNGINKEKEDKFYSDPEFYSKMSALEDEYLKQIDSELRKQITQLRNCFLNAEIKNLKNKSPKEVELMTADIESIYSDAVNNQPVEVLLDKIKNNPSKFLSIITSTKPRNVRAVYQKAFEINELINIPKCVKAIEKLVPKFDYVKNNPDFVEYSLTLYELGKRAREIYEREKHSPDGDYIDNDDMLVKARNLLKNNENVREAVQQDVQYLLVDEFQDTDDVQYDIIKFIIKDLDPSNEPRADYGNNLFIVGDPKQSIYSFRNADVRIFNKIKEDIVFANKKNTKLDYRKDLTEEQNYGRLTLKSTFRLKPFNAAFVNYACGRIFEADGQDYLPLVYPVRPEDEAAGNFINNGNVDYLLNIVEKKGKGGKQVILDAENEEEDSSEAELICRYIRRMVDEGKAEYSDFGILYRSRNASVANLYLKMIEHRIPYLDRSGGGFYNRPEVRDLVYLIKFLHDYSDDFALVSVLKSGYCGFTDNDLYTIYKSAESEADNYYFRLKYLMNDQTVKIQQHDLWDKMQLVVPVLEDLLSLSETLPMSILIYKFINGLNWYSKLEDDNQMERKIANTEKFIDITRSYFSSGFKTYYDFLQFIEYNESDAKQESQAVLPTAGNTVSIQTIHSAKGLEYKHVILPGADSGKSPKGDVNNYSFNEKCGFCFTFRKPNSETGTLDIVKSTFYDYVAGLEEEKAYSEFLRIAYVALTRAKEHLTIAATIKQDEARDENSMLSVAFPMDYAQLCGEKVSLENAEAVILRGNNESIIPLTGEPKIIHSEDKPEIKPADEIEVLKEVIDNDEIYDLRKPLAAGKIHDLISASRIMDYDEAVRNGDSDLMLGLTARRGKSRGNIPASKFGLIAHEVLANFNFWYSVSEHKTSSEKLTEAIKNSANKMCAGFEEKDISVIVDEVAEILNRTEKSGFFAEFAEKLENADFEREINYILNGNFLTTIFDVLINNGGKYEILDWKTNRLETKAQYDEKVKLYTEQMKLYCYMVYKMNPEQEVFTAKLIFLRLFGSKKSGLNPIVEISLPRSVMEQYEKELSVKIEEVAKYPFYGTRRSNEDPEIKEEKPEEEIPDEEDLENEYME